MRLLLDTNVVIWWLGESPRLGAAARAAIADPTAEVAVSAVSAAEIAIKTSLGKLRVPGDLPDRIAANAFVELPLTVRHALALQELPLVHRDPFDRMLIAQARVEGLTLVTADKVMSSYDVPLMAADR